MRFVLAAEYSAIPLVLSRPERTESGAELFDFSPVLRPISGALRGDRTVVVSLGLMQELGVRA